MDGWIDGWIDITISSNYMYLNDDLFYTAQKYDHNEENKKIYGMPPNIAHPKGKTGAQEYVEPLVYLDC